jgi:serine/threonine-protein kinase haspin
MSMDLIDCQWLHYLTVKLLQSKGLKAPARRKSQAPAVSGSAFTERDCYECLVDLEDWLGNCVAAVVAGSKRASKSKGKKKAVPIVLPTPAALLRGPLCAGEVVGYGVKKGWVKSLLAVTPNS